MSAARGSARPANVLHVLGSAAARGTAQARLVESLARHLDPSSFRLQACFVAGPEKPPAPGPLAAVPFTVTPYRGGLRPGELRGFVTAIHGARPDLVHLHVGGRELALVAKLASRSPIVVHVHGAVAEDGSSVRPPLRLAGRVIAASEATARAVAPDARVIHTGVENTEPGPGARSRPPIVGALGRIEPIKGLPYLIDAFAEVVNTVPDAELEIAGSGTEEGSLRRLAEARGLTAKVRFLGWQPEPGELLRRWRVLALPSLGEGSPLAAVEAMAAGTPVVASEVGGLPEIVSDGETGFLVPPARPEPLAARLREVLADDELAGRLGAAGRERAVERFSAERMASQVAAVYDSLLEEPG